MPRSVRSKNQVIITTKNMNWTSSKCIFTLLISRSCEKYELKSPLGKGKYSVVFKAMDTKHDRQVVVKILKPVRKPKINREIRILQSVVGILIFTNSINFILSSYFSRCPNINFQAAQILSSY